MNESAHNLSPLQARLSNEMIGIFSNISHSKDRYYSQHPDKIPQIHDVHSIVSRCANMNVCISGGVNLIPGPWGIAASIPEILGIMKNQAAMIHDLGLAHNKESVLNKELLMGVFLSAIGSGGIGLLTIRGQKVLVKQASLQLLQEIVKALAGNVTKQLIKSSISKWLPLLGAAAMAGWSGYSTHRVGAKAIEVFNKEIEFVPEEPRDLSDIDINISASDTNINFDILKIHAYINLMKIDGDMSLVEREFILSVISQVRIDEDKKNDFIDYLYTSSVPLSIDYEQFSNNPEDAIGLLIDLVALAKRDGAFHVSEKMYIKQAGKQMGFSDTDIEEMFVSA